VIGTWDLSIGGETTTADNARKFDCGLASPKSDEAALMAFKEERKMTVELKLPNTAINKKTNEQGTWTMVYDEGMEIRIGGKKYFAYFKYQKDKNDPRYVISTCSETVNGYVHKDDDSAWGCWKGTRRGPPQVFREQPPDDGEEMTQRQAEEHALEHLAINVEDAMYEPETEFVTAINALELGFTTKVYPQFRGKSLRQLRNRAGAHKPKPKPSALSESLLQLGSNDYSHSNTKYHLPNSWDWRNVSGKNFMFEAIDQGDCGSCYAVATADMISARVAVQTNNTVRIPLASQEILGCGAKWNQGCAGGFPYLSSKYVQDFGLTSELCYPYEERGLSIDDYPPCHLDTATAAHADACKYRVKVSKYDYIGGCYGCCSEHEMMKEIYENGPIVAAFSVNEALMHYSAGIFLEIGEQEMPKSLNRWEETNHAVVVVGWGVSAKGSKYWTVKNSWGANWGDHGYFYVERGTDVMAFESMAVAALPVVSDAMHVHAKSDLLKSKII